MATEIERKFLLADDGWRTQADDGVVMRQGYLSALLPAQEVKSSIRVRIAGEHANLNIKSATLGVTRQEYEYAIPLEDANELLDTLADGPLIEKTRYHVQHGAHRWEIDVFAGDNYHGENHLGGGDYLAAGQQPCIGGEPTASNHSGQHRATWRGVDAVGRSLASAQELNNATVTDIDGNIYTTVKIGDQVWMADNLRTTHYRRIVNSNA